jgi:hypothetical protein
LTWHKIVFLPKVSTVDKINPKFLLVFLLFLSFISKAQVMEPVRLELPAQIDVPAYNYEVLSEKGLLIFYESTELDEEGKRKWYFSLLDTNLREVWMQYVPLTDGLAHHSVSKSSGQMIFLFVTPEAKKVSQPVYEMLLLNLETNSFHLMGGSIPEKASVKGMSMIGNYVLLAINLQRYESDLLIYNTDNNSLKSIKHGIEGQSVIQFVAGDVENSRFLLALKRFENNRFAADVFMLISETGELIRTWNYKDNTNYLHAMTLLADSSDQMIVAGSFDNEIRRSSVKDAANAPELTNEAKGVFFLRFQGDEAPVGSFHSFESFTNIYKVLSTEDLIKIRQRMARSRDVGQDMGITFQFFEPKLIRHQDQFIYSAEAFKPQYRLETRMDYDFYGLLVPFSYSVFEGYNFFSTLVVSFGAEGQLNWSSDFEIRNVLVQRLRRNVSIIPDQTGIVMALMQSGVLTSKIIANDGRQLGQVEQTKVESTFTNDRLLEERFSHINHWYNENYIVSGYQRLSNNRLRTNNPRNVFYLQKLIFD